MLEGLIMSVGVSVLRRGTLEHTGVDGVESALIVYKPAPICRGIFSLLEFRGG
jgi:hypothetical protein